MSGGLTERAAKEWREARDAEEKLCGAGERHSPSSEPIISSSKQPTVDLTIASKIRPIAIDWLWDGWLAKGKLQLLAGQPGTGKTTLASAFAAIISVGGVWPDGSRANAGNVVIWSGEDDPHDTLVPRLMAAGADLARIHLVNGMNEDGAKRFFDPAKDMVPLSQEIKKIGAALVIIDPIAMMAVKDSHRNAETRRDLQPIAELCQATGAAALGIHHLAKGTVGREPQERLLGSVAFAAVARVVMIATKMAPLDDEKTERRAIMRAKSNIGPDDGGFGYTLEQIELEDHPNIFASRAIWGEAVEGTAREILAEAELDVERSPREDAKEFLLSFLSEGPVPVKEVRAAARREGISPRTLRLCQGRARYFNYSNRLRQRQFRSMGAFGNSFIGGQSLHSGPLKRVATYGEGGQLCDDQPGDSEK